MRICIDSNQFIFGIEGSSEAAHWTIAAVTSLEEIAGFVAGPGGVDGAQAIRLCLLLARELELEQSGRGSQHHPS